MNDDAFGSRTTLHVGDAAYEIHRLDALTKAGIDTSTGCRSR